MGEVWQGYDFSSPSAVTILDLLPYAGWRSTGDVRRAYNELVAPGHATRKWVQNTLKAAQSQSLVRSRRDTDGALLWQRIV